MVRDRRTIRNSSCSANRKSPRRWSGGSRPAPAAARRRSATSSMSRRESAMSRSNARGATVLALAATTLLGACTDMYLDRRDTVSFAAGDAVAANKVTHMIDPWPLRAGDRNIAFDGERMAAAAERYRTDKVKPLAGTGTSSVKYEPVLLQPSPK